MKRILSLVLVALMSVTLLVGCGEATDPIYEDLSNFLNVEMVDVNANHDKIAQAYNVMTTLEDDAAIAEAIQAILPVINDSIEKVEAITPATDEVLVLKETYASLMEAYKGGFEALLAGCETQDDAVIQSGVELMNIAAEILDTYNQSVEELAAEHGGEVEY